MTKKSAVLSWCFFLSRFIWESLCKTLPFIFATFAWIVRIFSDFSFFESDIFTVPKWETSKLVCSVRQFSLLTIQFFLCCIFSCFSSFSSPLTIWFNSICQNDKRSIWTLYTFSFHCSLRVCAVTQNVCYITRKSLNLLEMLWTARRLKNAFNENELTRRFSLQQTQDDEKLYSLHKSFFSSNLFLAFCLTRSLSV